MKPGHIHQSPPTILNVRGDDAGRSALSRALRTAGFSVVEAASGADALRLSSGRPDLVLLHTPLPDRDAAEVCRGIKADPANAPLLVCPGGGEALGELADACPAATSGPDELVPLVSAMLRARDAGAALRRGDAGGPVSDTDAGQGEASYRLLVQSVRDYAIFMLDPQGRVATWNAGAQRIKGYTAEEVAGQHLSVFYPPEDVAAGKAEQGLRVAAAEGRFEEEGWRLRKGGSRFWASVAITALRDPGGRLRGFAKVTRDLTERKRAEDELRRLHAELEQTVRRRTAELAEANAALRATLESIGDGVVTTDAEGRVNFLNPVAQALTGWANDQARGRPLEEVFRIVNEHTRQEAPNPVRRVLREGVVAGLANHTVLIARDGTERPIDDCAAPIRDDRGELRGVVLVFRDVTHERRQARALAESEARFRGFFEMASEGIWVLDEQARITLVNPRMAEVLGHAPEEMVGRLKWDFLFEGDRPHFQALFERRRAGLSDRADVRLRHRDGREVWALMAARPVFGEGGEFRGALDLFTDITERKRLEGELRRQAERLAQADRKKDEFLAVLAHELRGPLAPLLNALDILRLRGHDPGTSAAARELAERQVRQLARLVDDLLDVSRIARGKLALKKERVDSARLVAQAVDAVRPLMEARNHQLNVLLPAEPLELEADPARLVQVLTNLLTNAAKYTEPGGSVWVSAERDRDDVLLKVRDTGVGLPAELLPQLFELFAQAEPGSQGGLGIGLHLVRALVEMHGGSVLAFSEGPGEGCEFVVRLPAPRGEAHKPEAAGPPPPAGPCRRVLVVDDDIDGATSLALVLRLRGHEVKVAHDGSTALGVAHSFHPEVVLLDLALPGGLDGYEVARRLRQEEGLRDALVVALTGWGQEEDRRRAVEAGFDEFLVKPADPQALEDLLARHRA